MPRVDAARRRRAERRAHLDAHQAIRDGHRPPGFVRGVHGGGAPETIAAARSALARERPHLLVLGTGHSESVERANTNAALVVDGRALLIDCGYTAKRALARERLAFADVDGCVLTHVHADHCLGLERFAYESALGAAGAGAPLLVLAPGLRARLWDGVLRQLVALHGEPEATLERFFDVVDVAPESPFAWRGLTLTLHANDHRIAQPSYAVAIAGPSGARVLWTGDTCVMPSLVEAAPYDVIWHDAVHAGPCPVHATVADIEGAYRRETLERVRLVSYEDGAFGASGLAYAVDGERYALDGARAVALD